MIDGSNTVAHLKLNPLLCSMSDAMKRYALQYASVSATCIQDSKLLGLFKIGQYLWDIHKLLLYSFRKTIIWIYFKENVFLQPVA